MATKFEQHFQYRTIDGVEKLIWATREAQFDVVTRSWEDEGWYEVVGSIVREDCKTSVGNGQHVHLGSRAIGTVEVEFTELNRYGHHVNHEVGEQVPFEPRQACATSSNLRRWGWGGGYRNSNHVLDADAEVTCSRCLKTQELRETVAQFKATDAAAKAEQQAIETAAALVEVEPEGEGDALDNSTRVGNLRECACGCYSFTNNPASAYLPGHDAKHVSKILFDLRTWMVTQNREVSRAEFAAKVLDLVVGTQYRAGISSERPLLRAKAHRAADRLWEQISK